MRQEATLTIRMFGVGSLVHCMQPQACMSSIVDGLGMTRMVHVCVRRYPYTRTNSCLRRTFCSLQRVARDAMEEPWRGNSSHRGRRRAARSTIHRPRVRLAVADPPSVEKPPPCYTCEHVLQMRLAMFSPTVVLQRSTARINSSLYWCVDFFTLPLLLVGDVFERASLKVE